MKTKSIIVTACTIIVQNLVSRGFYLFGISLLLASCQGETSLTEPDLLTNPASYYIATDGDDGNPGTLAEPWQTVQFAADSVGAGDTVLVRGGVYNEVVFVNVSGSAGGGYITFMNYEDEVAVLDGTGFSSMYGDSAFYVEDQNYIVIEGFEVRNYTTDEADPVPAGIIITGTSHHIQLLNNHIHHIETTGGSDGNAHGIAVYGTASPASIHQLLIQGNELNDLKLGNSEALVLNGNVEQFTISQNIVHDNDNIGIDLIGFEDTAPNPAFDQARDGVVSDNIVYNIDTIDNPAYFGEQSAGGIYVDGGTRITIERNHVYQSNIGIEIASEHPGRATSFVTVRNNFIYHNHIAGLAMGGYDTNRGSTENCHILNNTFFENDSNQDGNGELWLQFDTRNNVIRNNIFYANDQSWLITNPYTENVGNVVDNNLFFTPAGASSEWQWQNTFYQSFSTYQIGTGNDTNSAFTDPQLTSTSQPNLHILPTSPALNAGIFLPEVGDTDIDGDTRLINGLIDIGADEHNPATQTNYPIFLSVIQKP